MVAVKFSCVRCRIRGNPDCNIQRKFSNASNIWFQNLGESQNASLYGQHQIHTEDLDPSIPGSYEPLMELFPTLDQVTAVRGFQWRVSYLYLRIHDDVIQCKHFPRYWPFVLGIHQSPVNSPHKDQWRGALMFSLIYAWINGSVNNREAGYLIRHRAHYDVTLMTNFTWMRGHPDNSPDKYHQATDPAQ